MYLQNLQIILFCFTWNKYIKIKEKCSFQNSKYLSGHRIIKIELKSIKTNLLNDNDIPDITEMVTNILLNYILTQLECLFLYFPNLFGDWKDA